MVTLCHTPNTVFEIRLNYKISKLFSRFIWNQVKFNASDMYVTLEQFANRVIEITTRYNSRHHVSYGPGNLSGRYVKYPAYGDFPETYTLREYGRWWKMSAANYQKPYRDNDVDTLGAEDFVTVHFDYAVIPTKLFIYETYSPGSIVRIWGRQMKNRWVLMWEGEPQKCLPEARKFQPEIRKLNCLVDTVRLELNCSELNHHTCLDSILLIGFSGSTSEFQLKCFGALKLPEISTVVENRSNDVETSSLNYFKNLPYEVIIHIFQFLDLKSLSNCACVSSEWNLIANDPLLYQNISLKKYWHLVDSRVFDFLQSKCKVLKKLDLSWCGNDDDSFPRKLFQFLTSSCVNLTHISLGNASYFNGSHLAALSRCLELEELRLKNVLISDLEFCHVETLCKLSKLVTLDLYSTNITLNLLIPLLKANPNLKYINLDFCDEIDSLDDVIEVVAEYNKELVGWSSWKGKRLSARGVGLLGNCRKLENIDLGWGLSVSPPEHALEALALGCKRLRRLILSGWRPVVDTTLRPIIENCTELEQLDLLSITGISKEFIEEALLRLPKLRLLELSFCDSIPLEKVEQWRITHPHVTIQRCLDTDSDTD